MRYLSLYMANMFNFSVLDQKKTKSNEGGRKKTFKKKNIEPISEKLLRATK